MEFNLSDLNILSPKPNLLSLFQPFIFSASTQLQLNSITKIASPTKFRSLDATHGGPIHASEKMGLNHLMLQQAL
jgi:hypothetical protein